MSRWKITEEWKGADAHIVGGGPSLRNFQWDKLAGKNVIGCNAAFKLGARIVPNLFFSDINWFNTFESELEEYTGRVFTHCEEIPPDHPWVLSLERREQGLHHDAIGFGGNSGCSAINLALLLGAKRVYLYGFDCKLGANGESNWHKHTIEAPNAEVYPKFQEGFYAIARDLPTKFPGCKIINRTPDSALNCFPKQ